ncbi:MAG: hypothetical protein RIT81_20765 [Deltaproteobacteria bacterium]
MKRSIALFVVGCTGCSTFLFDVDAQAPSVPEAEQMVLTRSPFGTQSSTRAHYVLEVDAPVEAGALVEVLQGAAVLGSTIAPAVGAFSFEIGEPSRAPVAVRLSDAAGNATAPIEVVRERWDLAVAPEATDTFDVAWNMRADRLRLRPRARDTIAWSPEELRSLRDGVAREASGVWWRVEGTGPAFRVEPALAYDAGCGCAVMFGGDQNSFASNETWLWDGRQWTRVGAGVAPTGSINANLVYDPLRDRMVLFGGRTLGAAPVEETWEWDGTTWLEIVDEGAAARSTWSATWDAGRGSVVRLGLDGVLDAWTGADWARIETDGAQPSATHVVHDAARDVLVAVDPLAVRVWELAATTWVEVAAATSPPPTRETTLFYDSRSQRPTLIGGKGDLGPDSVLEDTWTWDGSTWTHTTLGTPDVDTGNLRVVEMVSEGRLLMFGGLTGRTWFEEDGVWRDATPAPGPTPRVGPMAAWDPVGERIVVFGGNALEAPDDTWTWDGYRWRVLTSTSGPPGRFAGGFVTEPTTQQIHLYGGDPTSAFKADLWRLDGDTWTELVDPTTPLHLGRGGMAPLPDGGWVYFSGTDYAAALATIDDTWVYGEGGWQRLELPEQDRPPRMHTGASALDEARGQVVFYRGFSMPDAEPPATYVFEDGRWTTLPNADQPGDRNTYSMAYDADRAQVVLVGGYALEDLTIRDAFAWTGAEWVPIAARDAPESSTFSGMVYDRGHRELLSIAGRTPTAVEGVSDVWVLSRPSTQRVGAAIAVTPPSDLDVLSMRFEARVRARGTDTNGEVDAVVEVLSYHPGSTEWDTCATDTGFAVVECPIESEQLDAHTVRSDGRVHFLVRTRGHDGAEASRLELDDLRTVFEVRRR